MLSTASTAVCSDFLEISWVVKLQVLSILLDATPLFYSTYISVPYYSHHNTSSKTVETGNESGIYPRHRCAMTPH
jgi:hypothetical protein